MKSKRLSLNTWIDQTGQTAVAKLLGISPMTVHYWRRGLTSPKVTQMRRIVKLTKGAVGYAEIIDGEKAGRR